ncbi:hypothetical protein WJX84_011149 [Apatococcus fuscideae]|uniref:Uncharacterized protein n=1 Tax=Apatococcus fuscideae TaxID=2026836 RepID=A0AAW1SLX5_9CHLO
MSIESTWIHWEALGPAHNDATYSWTAVTLLCKAGLHSRTLGIGDTPPPMPDRQKGLRVRRVRPMAPNLMPISSAEGLRLAGCCPFTLTQRST